MKGFSQLSFKIILPSLVAVLGGIWLLVYIILNVYGPEYRALSKQYLDTLTSGYAQKISSQMELTLNTAETLALSIEAEMNSEDSSREAVLALVENVLANHPELIGIGVGFEPDAFDGLDNQNIGMQHSDGSGRFVPYTYHENGEIAYTQLEGYDDLGPDGSWYYVPKATGKTYVTNPYWYYAGSEQHLMFTCVAPILKDGAFVGMTGFDTPVDSLSDIVKDTVLFQTGFVFLVSPDGAVAYHPNEELVGGDISAVLSAEAQASMQQLFDSGEPQKIQSVSPVTDALVEYNMEAITVGESDMDSRWIVITNVPVSEIDYARLKTINTTIWITVAIGLSIGLLLSILLWIVVTRPIKRAKKLTASMACGILDIDDTGKQSNDEIGQMIQDLKDTSHTLQRYVKHITQTLSAMSSGDMTVGIEMHYIGDFQPIRDSMLHIKDNLNRTLSQISMAANEVSTGSSQVANGAQTLAQLTGDQERAANSLSANVTNISEQIKSTATNSAQVSEQVDTVSAEIQESNRRMQDMLTAMNEIDNSSSEIAKIVKTIEDIAFQTNILAINAAVEAAHAGSAGKGFAVVAEEVRSLAAKSAEASRNTAALIERSMLAVENGTKIAADTAQALTQVVTGVMKVSATMDDISAAAKAEAEFVDQITRNVSEISSVVQRNSNTAQQSAAVSEELSGQSQMMKRLVNEFKLAATQNSIQAGPSAMRLPEGEFFNEQGLKIDEAGKYESVY